MVKTEEHTWENVDIPKKKELYFDAYLKIRCTIGVAKDIGVRLRPGSARSELFQTTCFGPWLDVRSTSSDPHLVHLMLQTQYIPDGPQNALFFRVGGRELRFGPEEFCLITGLRFGPQHWSQGKPDVTFRERVFGHVATLKVSDLRNTFDRSLDQLSDHDAVRLCLLMLLEVGFMGHESSSVVGLNILQLVDDLDSWNAFPWGSYVWKNVYGQLHNALGKRSARLASIPTTRPLMYTLQGFIWAFKIWIYEVFPYARKFAIRRDGMIPRAIGWDKNKPITWKLALPLVMDAIKPGFEPVVVLTPTLEECATGWWKASRRFFDGFADESSPPLKKARSSPPPQLSDNSAYKTTMPMEDDVDNTTTCHQYMEEKLPESSVMKFLSSLEERVNELWKARRPHCVKTEMSTGSSSPLHHVEYHAAEGEVSSQCDMIYVQGYKVKKTAAPILKHIFTKHGDIAAGCVFKPASMRSSYLEIICEIVTRIQTDDYLEDTEEIEQQLLATEAANINVSWLRAHLEARHEKKKASKKCSLLMEVKANTILAKTAAQMDLRQRRVELAAARERVEQAERCVSALHLVEKNLNDSIFETKARIDSWARKLDL